MKYDEKHHLPHPVPITNGKLQSLVITSNCFQPHYSGKSNQNFLCNSGADEAEKATKVVARMSGGSNHWNLSPTSSS